MLLLRIASTTLFVCLVCLLVCLVCLFVCLLAWSEDGDPARLPAPLPPPSPSVSAHCRCRALRWASQTSGTCQTRACCTSRTRRTSRTTSCAATSAVQWNTMQVQMFVRRHASVVCSKRLSCVDGGGGGGGGGGRRRRPDLKLQRARSHLAPRRAAFPQRPLCARRSMHTVYYTVLRVRVCECAIRCNHSLVTPAQMKKTA